MRDARDRAQMPPHRHGDPRQQAPADVRTVHAVLVDVLAELRALARHSVDATTVVEAVLLRMRRSSPRSTADQSHHCPAPALSGAQPAAGAVGCFGRGLASPGRADFRVYLNAALERKRCSLVERGVSAGKLRRVGWDDESLSPNEYGMRHIAYDRLGW